MASDHEYTRLLRRVQTLESRLTDLVERLSAYESGTDKNPNRAIYVSDGRNGPVAQLDYDAAADALRIKKVR